MKNSYHWIEEICSRLFSAEKRRIDKRAETLNQLNNEIRGKVAYGFIHMGQQYIPEATKHLARVGRKNTALPPLAIGLINEARAFAHDAETVKRDEEEIRQLLFKLMVNCNNVQDVRNSLPECVVNLLPEVSKHKRTLVDPCYYIHSDRRAVKLYEKLLPKIEMYAMGHLLY